MLAHSPLTRLLALITIAGGLTICHGQETPISDWVYQYVNSLILDLRRNYYVFETADSGFNHGIPSGLFASDNGLLTPDSIDGSCVFDSSSPDVCTTAINVFDKGQSFLRLKIPRLLLRNAKGNVQYFGLNFEVPENYGVNRIGDGVDITGATAVTFEVTGKPATASGCQVKFGIRGSETNFMSIPTQPTEMTLPFDSLYPPLRRLTGVHTLFSIATDAIRCGGGGSVLVRKVKLTPMPNVAKADALGFPVANKTFGVSPLLVPCGKLDGRDIPGDQTLKNAAPIYESSLVLMGLLTRKDSISRANAQILANAFVSALNRPNSTLALGPRPNRPVTSPDAQDEAILNNSYRSGQLGFDDPQPLPNKKPGGPNKGEMALSGFSAAIDPERQGDGNFCLVLDGATGGNNAFAILALVAASRAFESGPDEDYLKSARKIAQWIINNLWSDVVANSGGLNSYGGYYLGWNDGGDRSPGGFLYGKSVENNADIYAAMRVLADREIETGDIHSLSTRWIRAALHAGEYVGRMKVKEGDEPAHFYGGTLPCTQYLRPGLLPESYCSESDTRLKEYAPAKDPAVDPSSGRRDPARVREVFNLYDFLDATTFVALALAGSEDYGGGFEGKPIDWAEPMQWSLERNSVSNVVSYGRLSAGFDLVNYRDSQQATADEIVKKQKTPVDLDQVAYPPGITWEFTGQAVVTMKLLNDLNPSKPFTQQINAYLEEIRKTQAFDHFAEGGGLPAATLNPIADPAKQERGSNMPGPYYSCLPTPFQCFASRVGLAATMWAAFAETGFNPLGRPAPKR